MFRSFFSYWVTMHEQSTQSTSFLHRPLGQHSSAIWIQYFWLSFMFIVKFLEHLVSLLSEFQASSFYIFKSHISIYHIYIYVSVFISLYILKAFLLRKATFGDVHGKVVVGKHVDAVAFIGKYSNRWFFLWFQLLLFRGNSNKMIWSFV